MTQASLVLELQQMASDPAVPVSSLLLKAKMVAVKLGLREMASQLDREIGGDWGKLKGAELPQYRWALGSLKVHNPYNGLCPIVIQNAEQERLLSRTFISNSIHELEDSLDEEKAVWTSPLSDGQREWLQENVDHMGMPILNVVSKNKLLGIVSAVRAAILDWALDLEQRGILGEGLSFTPKEKEAASTAGTTINIGQLGSMQGVLGSVTGSSVTQDLVQSVVTHDRESLMSALRKAGVPDADLKELDKAIDAEPKAKNGKIGERVGAWVGGMAQKVVTGVWKAAQNKGIELIVSAINAHYGLGAGGGSGASTNG